MELENLQKLKQVLSELDSQAEDNLSDLQKEKIKEANAMLQTIEQEANKKKTDWNTIISLGMQAASLIVEIFKSG